MKKLCLVLFTVFNCLYSYGNGLDSLKNVLDSIAKNNGVIGMGVSVITEGRVRWNHQYGFKNLTNKARVDSLTLFQFASISKPLTALAILKLHEEGVLHLDSNVNKYLKGWQLKENRFTRDSLVTIRKLLNHTGGTNFDGTKGYRQDADIPSTIDILNGKGNTPKLKVKYIPGSKWIYSGGGYLILQKVIEDLSGSSFEDYMQRNILLPMKMNRSTFKSYKASDSLPDLASGYTFKGKELEGGWYLRPESAPAGLWSTTIDLCKYIIEIQEILEGKKGGVISQESALEMLKQGKNKWGLGPYTRLEKDGMWYFGHTGGNDGYSSIFDGSFELKQGGIVIIFNSDIPMSTIHDMYTPVFDYYGW